MSCDQRNSVRTGERLRESHTLSIRLLPNILQCGQLIRGSGRLNRGRGDAPDTPYLCGNLVDLYTSREALELFDPCLEHDTSVDVRVDFVYVFAHDHLLLWTDFVPIFFHNCARRGVAWWPRPACCRSCVKCAYSQYTMRQSRTRSPRGSLG